MSRSGEILGWHPLFKDKRKSDHTVHKGRKAERTSWILRATTLRFIYTLDVLISKLSLSVSVSSNDKALMHRSLLIAYLIVLSQCFAMAYVIDTPS